MYAATAYAVVMGTAEAFAPQAALGGHANLRRFSAGQSPQTGGTKMMAWTAPAAGYDPKNRGAPASSAPAYSAPAPTRGNAREAARDAAPASGGGWKPPTGYGSETISRASSAPASSVPAYSAPASGDGGWRPPTGYGSDTISRSSSAPAYSAPVAVAAWQAQATAAGWRPPTGYGSDTLVRASAPASSASAPAYSAPMPQASAAGWRPPTGYGSETLTRGDSRAAAPAYSAPAAVNSPMTSAPEKKWAGGYGGYDPKRR